MGALPTTLADWLEYQQRVHPHAIELGLDRVRAVWQRLGAPAPAPVVFTVGGTNGKGSTVAFLEAMLAADGRRVGTYTSPHLLRYNERIRVLGEEVDDEALVAAFARIEAARGDIALTYFEYGTLAALWLFAQSRLDVAVLEVGLGGRLDAVNIIDADAAIVTTIALDHQAWLGNDRESIGREKAGIFREGRPAIIGEGDPPDSLVAEAMRIGADLRLAGRDFTAARDGPDAGWEWRSDGEALVLPAPALDAPCQIANASAAVAALYALRDRLGWNPRAMASGVAQAQVGARLQRFRGTPELIVDVAHNPQAASVLAQWLRTKPAQGRTLAVFGALDDKDVLGIVTALVGTIDTWFLAGLDAESPRGLAAEALRETLAATGAVPLVGEPVHADVASALEAAFASAGPDDRVIAFGSFFVAAAALRFAASKKQAA